MNSSVRGSIVTPSRSRTVWLYSRIVNRRNGAGPGTLGASGTPDEPTPVGPGTVGLPGDPAGGDGWSPLIWPVQAARQSTAGRAAHAAREHLFMGPHLPYARGVAHPGGAQPTTPSTWKVPVPIAEFCVE